MYNMPSVVIPFKGKVEVRRSRGEIYIYVNRRDPGGRLLAKYGGARVNGFVIIIKEDPGDAKGSGDS